MVAPIEASQAVELVLSLLQEYIDYLPDDRLPASVTAAIAKCLDLKRSSGSGVSEEERACAIWIEQAIEWLRADDEQKQVLADIRAREAAEEKRQREFEEASVGKARVEKARKTAFACSLNILVCARDRYGLLTIKASLSSMPKCGEGIIWVPTSNSRAFDCWPILRVEWGADRRVLLADWNWSDTLASAIRRSPETLPHDGETEWDLAGELPQASSLAQSNDSARSRLFRPRILGQLRFRWPRR